MSALPAFSEAQLFFLAFASLTAPVFSYLYLRATPDGGSAQSQRYSFDEELGISDEVPARGTQTFLPPDSAAKPSDYREPAYFTLAAEGVDQRDEVFPPGATSGAVAGDIIILPLHQEPSILFKSEAGFPAKAHYQVPGDRSFQIMLEVKGLLAPQELELEMASSAASEGFGLLTAEICEGEDVGLFLECRSSPENAQDERAIYIDTPYQAFSLGSRPVTAIFLAHSGAVEHPTKADMSLRVMVGGEEIGAIDFDIIVYPLG